MNDFQFQNKLGEGAYSIVHKVIRNADEKVYALKKVKLLNLSEKEKTNALNEVRILASIKSNFVISYKEAFFDENESTLGIVMEYADKGDLYQKICEFKKAGVYFEESDIWRIFIQMVKGLKSLHDLKILHRDLKSANIFLFTDGSAKLGDLNVSKVAKRGLGYTQTGTPYYASPEVWKDQPYDSKSDIWSLGCVLYEMIALKPPFRAENMEGLFNKVTKGQYSKIPERFSSDLQDIIKMLLQVLPETRPSCDQILKHSHILKRTDFIKNFSKDDDLNNNLLQTIKIPKNLLILTERLPQKNYGEFSSNISKENIHFPEILTRKQKQKKKEKGGGDCNSVDMAVEQPFFTQEESAENNRSRKRKAKDLNKEIDRDRSVDPNALIKKVKLDDILAKVKVEAKQKNTLTIDNEQRTISPKREENKERDTNQIIPINTILRNDSNILNLPAINLNEALNKKKMDEKQTKERSDYHHSMEKEILIKRGNDKKVVKIITNSNHPHYNNNDEIYKIYGIKNDSIKNRIDRSIGLKYDLYKPKKHVTETKVVQVPRKLSPLRKLSTKKDEY